MLKHTEIKQVLTNITLENGDIIDASKISFGHDDAHKLMIIIQLEKSLVESESRRIQEIMQKSLMEAGETRLIQIVLSAPRAPREDSPEKMAKKLDHIKKIILVGSGKGGVGKSTLSLNLAAGFALQGNRVGLLDADIYGPSMAQLLGADQQPEIKEGKAVPQEFYKVKTISMSYLVEPNTAIIWRGPMVMKAVQQFLFDVHWGELDYLFIDLPPGTGDIPLSIAQNTHPDGAVIVTTGHDLALADAIRAIAMFQKLDVPIIGIVENMAGFSCPNCGTVSHIFDSKDMAKEAARQKLNFLGAIPLTVEMRESADNAIPFICNAKNDAHITKIFFDIIEKIQLITNKPAKSREK